MVEFFVDRPVFSTVISIVIVLAGVIAVFTLPIAQYPGSDAADGSGDGPLSGGQRTNRARHGRGADRRAGQRRRGHDVHVVAVAPTTAPTT